MQEKENQTENKQRPIATAIIEQMAVILVDLGILFAIHYAWLFAELIEYGFSVPTVADTIAALIIYCVFTPKINERMWRYMKNKGKKKGQMPISPEAQAMAAVNHLRTVPIPTLLSSLELTVGILQERGVQIRDWDAKNKVLKQIRKIGNGIYFFAETESEAGSNEEQPAEK